MQKLLIIGDSLSLLGHLNKYEDTWIYKLKSFPLKAGYDFITFLKRQLTTDVLLSMGGGTNGIDQKPKGADCLEFFEPSIIILQLGIVDCAPRLIKEHGIERIFINNFPHFISTIYLKILKKVRKRSEQRAYVPIDRFESNLFQYFERCQKTNVSRVIFILIGFPDTKMLKKNSEIGNVVLLYNKIILNLSKKYDFVTCINPLDSRNYKYEIFEDGYHPNKIGHQLIFDEIVEVIKGV